jgi:hypothetical protein
MVGRNAARVRRTREAERDRPSSVMSPSDAAADRAFDATPEARPGDGGERGATDGGATDGSATDGSATDGSATDGDTPVRPWWERRRMVATLLLTGWLAGIAWRLWLARSLPTPVVLGDESRYMIFARVLAGGPGGYGGDTEATRRAGYALLISPMYWFTSNPFLVYRLVQGLNAVLNAATFPLAYLFSRRVLGADRRWALGIAVVASSLPAVVFFSAFALPNAVLTPLLLGWLLALHGWITGGTARARLYLALASGAVIGFMYVVHVRALLLLGVHVLVAVGLLVARRVRLTELAASAVGVAATFVLHPILKGVLAGQVITGGTEPGNRVLSAFTTVDGILRTVSDATGQIWYLCVGTWGLVALGLAVAGYRLVKLRDYPWPTAVIVGVCMVSTLAIAVITSAALPDDNKINNHFYPGYIIFLAPVWAMVGLAALRGAGWRTVSATGAGAVALIGGAWFVVASYTRTLRPLGVPANGISPTPKVFSQVDAPEVLFLAGDWNQVHLARATALALAMLVVAAGLLLPRRFAAAAVVALLAATAVNVLSMGTITREMATIAEAWSGPQLVRDAEVRPGELVVCDEHVLARFNHQREVYWRSLPLVDLEHTPPPADASVVIAPWHTGDPALDWNGTAHGFRRLVTDERIQWAAWRRAS